jgi:phasin family protein
MDKTFKTAEDFIAFGQGNVEAFVRASQIWATGVQDLSKQIAASTQAQVEESFDTVKALSAVKSLKEAVDLHSSLSKTAVEKTLAESTRFADAAAKLAEQAFAPITERMAIATEAFARPIV